MKRRFLLTLIIPLWACGTDTAPAVSSTDAARADVTDIALLDSADDSGRVDVPADTAEEPDTDEPDTGLDAQPDASACATLGCPCDSDRGCESGLCVPFGVDGLGICSEFCDGSCSEPGYTCELFNLDGREVSACFAVDTYCQPCAETAGCGSDANVCLTFEDGAFCASSCEIHGYCARGATCTSVRQGEETLAVCTPDSGVCAPCVDPDSDGFGIGAECRGPDCNQSNPDAYEGAPELCDGVDNDCDLELDEGYDLRSDPSNCGRCGIACSIENAAASCDVGECVIGACLDGFADCEGGAADGCETDLSDPDLCGVCGPLDGQPGDPCGTCGSGFWECDGIGAVVCTGDLGAEARNGCGGCGPLDGVPSAECAPCSAWTCGAAGGVTCELTAGDENACGGCGALEGAPGEECAPCSEWTCGVAGDVSCERVAGDENTCGGCGPLAGEPGDACGSCDLGLWVCVGEDALCVGDTGETNPCGGCATLVAEPDTACGACGLDLWACAGPDGLVCDGDTRVNDCGGCGDLVAELGGPCGACSAGAWACDGTESVECIGGGDDARNLCGGCGELDAVPDSPCGPCGDGLVICNGIEATRCIDAGADPDGDGVCGDDDVCPGGDDRADADGDLMPDACDPCPFDNPDDPDGDGVCTSVDACLGEDDRLDADGDGVPDACDPCPSDSPDDTDGDGVCESVDACPGFHDSLDADGDGAPDLCDVCPGEDDRVDGDSDGVPDGCDICLAGDDSIDGDGDTTPDACDVCLGGDDRIDTDGNGIPDACDTGTIVPGSTTIAEVSGFSVRCLEWSGDLCTHMQQRGSCEVCSAYSNCDQWHNTTNYNNGDNRTAINWCYIATGDPTVVSAVSGAAASFPAGCGWSASSHPICETGRMSIVMPDPGISSDFGLLMDPAYCDDGPTLMVVECGGW